MKGEAVPENAALYGVDMTKLMSAGAVRSNSVRTSDN